MTEDIKKLYDLALAAMKNAHCPISNYKVGAAVETTDGELYAGCNVETIAFTTSTHAETNAIDTAVTHGMKGLRRVLVITNEKVPVFSCALCRQRIIEFGKDTEIIASNLTGDIRILNIAELYPEPFVAY